MKEARFEFKGSFKLMPDGTKVKEPYNTMEEAMDALEKVTEKIMNQDIYKNQGKPVPQHKKDLALSHVQEMMPEADSELHAWIVGKAASLIEKDMLFALIGEVEILDAGLAKLDLVGRYRLAATLLA